MSESFEDRLKTFIDGCQKLVDEQYKDHPFGSPKIAVCGGRKYVKIARYENDSDSPSCVFCFVDSINGNVLKAASWSAPAKHARGNIYNDDNGLSCMSAYGPAYLRS